jgi:hypothetical protein
MPLKHVTLAWASKSATVAALVVVSGCVEAPSEPVNNSGTGSSRAVASPQRSAAPVALISVALEVAATDGTGRSTTLTSNALYRSRIAPGVRFVSIPAFAEKSSVARAFDKIARTSSELAGLIAKRNIETSIEVVEPAAFATTLCSDKRAWSRRSQSRPNSVVIEEGIGDSPATRTSVLRDGREVIVQERKWRRTANAWVLTAVTTRGPGNAYVQHTSVNFVTDSGSASVLLSVEVPRVKCASSETSARTDALDRSAPSVPTTTFTKSQQSTSGYAFDCEDPMLCEKEKGDWNKAVHDVIDAHVMSTAACLAIWLPPPVGTGAILACAAALYHEALMVARAEKARNDYWTCMNKPVSPLPDERVMSSEVSSTNSDAWLTSPRRGPVNTFNALATCGGGGGGGGGGGPIFTCHFETWEISYDGGETWQPIQVSVCEME